MRNASKWSIVLGALLCVLPATRLLASEVSYVDSEGKTKRVKGKITAETATEVTIDGQAIPVNKIEVVKYDETPAEMVTLLSMERQGRWPEVLQQYQALAKSAKDPMFKASVDYGIFNALAEIAKLDPTQTAAAQKAYDKFKTDYPESRFRYPLHEKMGQVFLEAGQFDDANKAFTVLKEVDWPGYSSKATAYQALAALRQGNAKDAIDLADTVISQDTGSPETKALAQTAQVYKAEALVMENKPKDAEKILRKVLEDVSKEDTLTKAMGYNALGDALTASGKDKNAVLEGYMFTVVVYNRDPEQTARALYNLSKVLPKIGSNDRAQQMAAELMNNYPKTSWAKKLQSRS